MHSWHTPDNMGLGKSPTVAETQRISFLLADGFKVFEIHRKMGKFSLKALRASPCARRPFASAVELPIAGWLDKGHSLPALWARAWGSAARQLGVCSASVVAHLSECQCSASLLSGDVPASQGDDLPHFWKRPPWVHLSNVLLIREPVSDQDCGPVSSARSRPLSTTCDEFPSADAGRVVGQYV